MAAALLAALAACSDPTGLDRVAGLYCLRLADGEPLPYVVHEADGYQVYIPRASLRIERDGRYTDIAVMVTPPATPSWEQIALLTGSMYDGTVTESGGELTFRPALNLVDQTPVHGYARGDTIAVTAHGVQWSYVRVRDCPV